MRFFIYALVALGLAGCTPSSLPSPESATAELARITKALPQNDPNYKAIIEYFNQFSQTPQEATDKLARARRLEYARDLNNSLINPTKYEADPFDKTNKILNDLLKNFENDPNPEIKYTVISAMTYAGHILRAADDDEKKYRYIEIFINLESRYGFDIDELDPRQRIESYSGLSYMYAHVKNINLTLKYINKIKNAISELEKSNAYLKHKNTYILNGYGALIRLRTHKLSFQANAVMIQSLVMEALNERRSFLAERRAVFAA